MTVASFDAGLYQRTEAWTQLFDSIERHSRWLPRGSGHGQPRCLHGWGNALPRALPSNISKLLCIRHARASVHSFDGLDVKSGYAVPKIRQITGRILRRLKADARSGRSVRASSRGLLSRLTCPLNTDPRRSAYPMFLLPGDLPLWRPLTHQVSFGAS